MISRRVIQTLLGVVWFVDGLLQLKPQMFTPAFIKEVILPTGNGEPRFVSAIVNWGAGITVGHIALWNSIFAVVQLGIGLALISNFKTKATIITSIIWSAIVWGFGEGFGQILTGQTLLLNGAPGAVVIYALIGIAIWTDKNRDPSSWSKRGIRFAQLSLGTLFLLGCVLHFQGSYLSPTGLSQEVTIPWLAEAIGKQGVIVSIIMAFIELAIATMLILRIRIQAVVWVSIVLSLVFWWAGQSFGQIFSPLATDFNTGLLMAILALCAHPMYLWKTTKKSTTRRNVLA